MNEQMKQTLKEKHIIQTCAEYGSRTNLPLSSFGDLVLTVQISGVK